jgi:RimK family alpha-L-glutamate ligase
MNRDLNKMNRFKDFLREQDSSIEKIKQKDVDVPPEDSKPDLIVLTNRREEREHGEDKLFATAERIKEICSKRDIRCYIVFVEDAHILRHEDGQHTIHNSDDKEGFPVLYDQTVAIIRGSIARLRTTMDLISQIEKIGIFCINYRDTMEMCSDKYRTILKLAEAALPAPKTALLQGEDTLEFAFETVGGEFPVIVKMLSGSKGVGVFFAESWKSLKGFLQMIWKISEEEELLIQQYIETDHDYRVHVLGDDVIAAMKRFVVPGDFRSNFSLGGKVEETTLTEEEMEMCIMASKAVRATWSGVDFVRDKDGNPYILEINSSPGTTGIEEATNEDVVNMVVDHALDRDNWRLKARECGWIETLEIDDIGIFKGKFDTGNGSLCVLHAENYTISDGMVKWKFGDAVHKKPYKTIKKVRVGGLRDYIEERPVVELDVTFDGVIYRDIDFTLDDRRGRTPVLINRRFMRKANLMVNPGEKYLITTMPE